MAKFGKDAFTEGLEQLGYTVENLEGNRVSIPFSVTAGRFSGHSIWVGIDVPPDFAVTCPTGPHIRPRLIPINAGGQGNDRAAESPFGAEWEYFSRPFGDSQQKAWQRTQRDVKTYLWHVRRILESL